MGVEFVDYTLLKKKGLLKDASLQRDASVQTSKFNFGKDGFVDLGSNNNASASTSTSVETKPQNDYLSLLATPLGSSSSVLSTPTSVSTPVSETSTNMAQVPDFLSSFAQSAANETASVAMASSVEQNHGDLHAKIDDLSRTMQILVDRISEMDIKLSKLSGNFK